jgi:nitric oxide reductase subunit B
MQTKKLWLGFTVVMVVCFGVLNFFGGQIYREKPPIPARVMTSSGTVLFSGQDIKDGQNIWQSIGGQEVGTIWGHGSYVAPDWSADWLHRESVIILDYLADSLYLKSYNELPAEDQAALKVKLQRELRTNTYDAAGDRIIVSNLRARAIREVSKHYSSLFMADPSLDKLRDAYAIPPNTIKTDDRMFKMNAFFFWLPHQSADSLVLYAGTEYDSRSRTYCLVRGLWNARYRSDAVRS